MNYYVMFGVTFLGILIGYCLFLYAADLQGKDDMKGSHLCAGMAGATILWSMVFLLVSLIYRGFAGVV